MRNYLIFSLLLLSVFVGCRPSKQVAVIKSDELNLQPLDFTYLTAKGKIVYTDGKEEIKANTDIRMLKDSVIWLSMRSGVGIEGVRALVQRDSIWIINRLDKEVFAHSYASLYEMTDFEFTFGMLQAVITGELPIEVKLKNKMRTTTDYFEMRDNVDNLRVELFFSRLFNSLAKVDVLDKKSQNRLMVSYDNFEKVDDNQQFPMHMNASLDYTRNRRYYNFGLDLAFSKVELSSEPMSFPFNIPSKFKRVDTN